MMGDIRHEKRVDSSFCLGERIRSVMHERSISVSELASRLCCSRENAHRILRRSNMDYQLIIRISDILEHNFFSDLADFYESRREV